MYYQKFSEINKAFHDNEFSTVAIMFAVVIFYMGLLTFACITLAMNTPNFLCFPIYIWPQHPAILAALLFLYTVCALTFYIVSTNMEIKRDPVKKRLAKIYLIISQIMLPTLIVERLLRVISWVIINTGYMVVNFVYGLFYKLPYWILKVTTPTEPKKPKHDLKTVLNDVEALVKR